MTTPLDDFRAYLLQHDTTGFVFAKGRWTETAATSGTRYIVLRQSASRRPVLNMRYIGVQVLIVGKREEGATMGEVEAFANGLNSFVQQRKTGCSIVAVSTLTDVVGPSFTQENRPVYELNFEMMYQTEEI